MWGQSLDGWFDDDIAFVRPWGFELDSIHGPVLHWQGEQDRFVPFGHGVWFSEHIPGVESQLSPDDGHLTLTERHLSPFTPGCLSTRRSTPSTQLSPA